MKRTPLKRRTRIRRRPISVEEFGFRVAVVTVRSGGRCERCMRQVGKHRLQAHHIVPRGRAPGWDGLHKPENGAALCRECHTAVHDHTAGDWRAWLRSAPRAGEAA